MPKAFISYARDGSHGENLAAEIQQQLQAAGFVVFRDVTGLKPGDQWSRKLEFELETSDVMVLVLSEKVRTSKWVHNEFSLAEEIGIPVIPVLAEAIRHPLWVRHLQVLDFCGAKNWIALFEAMNLLEKLVTESVVGRYVINNNSTVTDTRTGLMWKRYSEGLSGDDCCVGTTVRYNWDDAISMFDNGVSFGSYNNWRIPTVGELLTLVDKNQQPAIDHTVFPNSGWAYWSATEKGEFFAFFVSFSNQHNGSHWDYRRVRYHVRLVRSVQ